MPRLVAFVSHKSVHVFCGYLPHRRESMNAVLLRELEELQRAPIERLRVKCRELFGEEPRSRHKEQSFRRIAWRMQALVEGELAQRARRRAGEIAQDADLRAVAPRASMPLGAVLKAVPTSSRAKTHHDRRIPVAGT